MTTMLMNTWIYYIILYYMIIFVILILKIITKCYQEMCCYGWSWIFCLSLSVTESYWLLVMLCTYSAVLYTVYLVYIIFLNGRCIIFIATHTSTHMANLFFFLSGNKCKFHCIIKKNFLPISSQRKQYTNIFTAGSHNWNKPVSRQFKTAVC